MQRGNNKHSPRVDEQLAEEVIGIVQGTVGARAQEWRVSEPSGEDQPQVTVAPDGFGLGEPDGVGNPGAEELSRFGTYIGRSALPGDRAALERSARDLHAPDDVLERIRSLPADTTFRTVVDAWRALGGHDRRETP